MGIRSGSGTGQVSGYSLEFEQNNIYNSIDTEVFPPPVFGGHNSCSYHIESSSIGYRSREPIMTKSGASNGPFRGKPRLIWQPGPPYGQRPGGAYRGPWPEIAASALGDTMRAGFGKRNRKTRSHERPYHDH
ncbi:unnamed protein product, partial [Iphiclides podalirius]